MYLYTVIEAIFGIAVAILLAICTKKSENVIYTKLDKAGRITNIALIILYVCTSPFYIFLGMIFRPRYEAFLGILGWVISIIGASTALLCGIGIGLSVALRKKGNSKLSFAAQFMGLAGIALTVIIFFAFYGNLLAPLN